MRLALSANYERLQHSVARSPLVEDDHVFGYFAGLAWQFLTWSATAASAVAACAAPACPAMAADPAPVRLVVKPLLCVLDKDATDLRGHVRHPLEKRAGGRVLPQ